MFCCVIYRNIEFIFSKMTSKLWKVLIYFDHLIVWYFSLPKNGLKFNFLRRIKTKSLSNNKNQIWRKSYQSRKPFLLRKQFEILQLSCFDLVSRKHWFIMNFNCQKCKDIRTFYLKNDNGTIIKSLGCLSVSPTATDIFLVNYGPWKFQIWQK